MLAAAGYALADGSDALGERWRGGAERLAERGPFPTDRASFFHRPVELFGLARGAVAVNGEFA